MSNKVSSQGFTLVEVLVVIAILGLVVGLVGPRVMSHFGKAKADTARLQIADFSAALDLFFLDNGRYPTTDEGLDALVARPTDIDGWDGPYLKKSKVPEDPWGAPYDYRSPGDIEPFELVSLGADRVSGGDGDNTDIASWE